MEHVTLLVVHGEAEGASGTHTLKRGANVVGRKEEGARGIQVALANPAVSKQHARITVGVSAVTIADLDSRNHTYTGGHRVVPGTEVALEDGAVLRMGDVVAVVRFGVQAPAEGMRPEDVLAHFLRFVAAACARSGREVPRLGSTAAEALVLHTWPGGHDELRDVAERTLLEAGAKIEVGHLPEHVDAARKAAREVAPPARDKSGVGRAEVTDALTREGGNVKRAAEVLGVSRRKLYRLCEELGLDLESFR